MFVMGCLLCGQLNAHQWTPTYPKLENSFVDGVLTTKMKLFNKREDVKYYSVGVYDADFYPVAFATPERVIVVPYLGTKYVDVYIRDKDKGRAVYICSNSKHLKSGSTAQLVTSRICSKIK